MRISDWSSDVCSSDLGVVAENLPEFEERDRLDEIESVSRRNPALGEFVSDPRSMAMASDDIGALDALSAALSPGPTAMLAGGPIGQAQAAFSALLSSNFINEAVGAAHAGWYRGERNETLLLSDTGPQVVDPATGQMTSDRSAETGVLAANLERRAQAVEQIGRASCRERVGQSV